MEIQSQTAIARRRSDRVSIAFPVEASGIDPAGEHFCESTKTITVSRYGCCLSLPRLLPPEQQIFVNRVGAGEKAVGQGGGADGFGRRGIPLRA